MITHKNLIIDAFPGYNELDLASFRIHYLSNLVDITVIAEAKLTQSGLEKPLYFNKWLSEQSASVKEKVIVIEVPLLSSSKSWEREIYTREYLFRFIRENFPDSKFILSDLDEVPSRDQVEKLKEVNGIFHFHTPTFYRRVNWQLRDEHINWSLGVMGQVVLNVFPNAGRFTKEIPKLNGTPGAHFSWLGLDQKSLWVKSRAAAHAELNQDFWASKELLDFCDLHRIDHLGRGRNRGCGIFEVTNLAGEGVSEAAYRFFPEWGDVSPNIPCKLKRLWATMKLTAYVSDDLKAKSLRSRISPEDYFKSDNFRVASIVMQEIIKSVLAHLKLMIRLLIPKVSRN